MLHLSSLGILQVLSRENFYFEKEVTVGVVNSYEKKISTGGGIYATGI